MTGNYELAFVIGGLFLSLSVFSLVLGDNFLFRLGAAILSGAVSAYVCVMIAEKYFYPMIQELIGGYAQLSTAQIIRAVLVIIGIVLLFCKAYTAKQSGGKAVMTILMAIASAVLVFGAVSGTIPAFVKSLSAQFRVASLSAEQKGNVWYWVNAGTVLISAIVALLYTRHYSVFRKGAAKKGSGFVLGDIVVGFTFGALAAAVFVAAANIFVNHISDLITSIQTLVK